jgi:hypothetical protein
LVPIQDGAIALQHRFKFEIQGDPLLPEIPRTLMFDIAALPGVEAFDAADLALDSEPTSILAWTPSAPRSAPSPKRSQDPAERARIDALIKDKAFNDFGVAAAIIGRGTRRNGWGRPPAAAISATTG